MTKRRASLAGRGVEILFGEEPEESPVDSATPSDQESSEEVLPAGDTEEAEVVDLATMLEEEAQTAVAAVETEDASASSLVQEESVSTQEPTVSVETEVDQEQPYMPETVETTSETVEEALPALATTPAQPEEALPELATTPAQPEEEPEVPAMPSAAIPESETVEPAYEPETPPAPTYTPYVEPQTPQEEPPAPLPPPREKPEASDPVVRAKLMGMLYETDTVKPTDKDLEPDGPKGSELVIDELTGYETGQPYRVRREREVIEYVGPERRQSLWNEITDLYETVPDLLCTDENLPRALRLLQEAQDILLENPRQFDVAQYKVGQVQGIVKRRQNTSRWANTYGWGTFVYEVLWIGVLGVAIFFAPFEEGLLALLWNTAVWGGIGGVIAAFYSLYWHVAKKKDFDKQYVMWYIVKPIVGLLVGGLIFLFVGSGFIAARGETASGVETAIDLFPYAVACIAGFRQQFFLEIIDRIIQLLTPAEPSKPAVTSQTSEPESAQ